MANDLDENIIYLGFTNSFQYPSINNFYAPDQNYPEYPLESSGLSNQNSVYETIRHGFYLLGYDKDNYGKPKWNPLGVFIKQGNTVLLKPNWVMHYNKHKDYANNLDCLITHPSIVRVVIDYVIIALAGTGRIIIADAPMQGCDLETLFKKSSYDRLFDYYRNKKVPIEVYDLRHCRAVAKDGLLIDSEIINPKENEACIDLGKKSLHKKSSNLSYKVSDYSTQKTNQYHQGDKHIYSINKLVLQADCVINLPKPKCHRLAGITAAQKNIVGIVYDKSSLPHRIIGPKTKGGDEYQHPSLIKKTISNLEELKLRFTDTHKLINASLINFIIKFLYGLVIYFFKDKKMIGSWYGNDTIWRTVADLNYILRYANKEGVIKEEEQRKVLNIADMIIAGQGNGPIGPHPKELGMVIMGEDSSYIDELCVKIMGFNLNNIPGLKKTIMQNNKTKQKSIINNIDMKKFCFDDLFLKQEWVFDSHINWKGHIENEIR